jgi:hypothetical protein
LAEIKHENKLQDITKVEGHYVPLTSSFEKRRLRGGDSLVFALSNPHGPTLFERGEGNLQAMFK